MMGFSLSQDLDLHLEPGLITEILDKLLLSSSSPLPPFMIPMYIEEMLVNTLRSLNMIEQPDLKQPDLLLSTPDYLATYTSVASFANNGAHSLAVSIYALA